MGHPLSSDDLASLWLFAAETQHCRRVARHAQQLWAELSGPIGLSRDASTLLTAASILHDIARPAGKKGHHLGGARLVEQLRTPTLKASQKRVLARAIELHSKQSDIAAALKSRNGQGDEELALRIAALLRIADGLDNARGEPVKLLGALSNAHGIDILIDQSADAAANAADAMARTDLFNALSLRPIRAIRVVKSRPSEPRMRTSGQAIGAYCRRQAESIAARRWGVGCIDEVEMVHEMRVATRRLRSALSLLADCPVRQADEQALGDLVEALGLVRDADVFAESLHAIGQSVNSRHHPAIARMIRRHHSQRLRVMADLAEQLDSPAVLGALARVSRLSRFAPNDNPPLANSAPKLLKKRLRALLKGRVTLSRLPAKKQHAVRMAVKHLRYSCEALSPAYGDELRQAVKPLPDLQDSLGAMNDDVVHADVLSKLARRGDADEAAAVKAANKRLKKHRLAAAKRADKIWRRLRSGRPGDQLAAAIAQPKDNAQKQSGSSRIKTSSRQPVRAR